MKRLTTDGRLLAGGVFALTLLTLATTILINRPAVHGDLSVGSVVSPPAATGTASAILARRNTRTGVVEMLTARPSIEDNLGHSPLILIARVRGIGTAVELREDDSGLVSPLDLVIERILVKEIELSREVRYVVFGGTTANGYTERVEGLGPRPDVGGRYVFYLDPFILEDGSHDLRHMVAMYAMPIDSGGAVSALSARGATERTTLSSLVARVEQTAARGKWQPNPGRGVRR